MFPHVSKEYFSNLWFSLQISMVCIKIQNVSNCARLTIDSPGPVHLRDWLMMRLVTPTIRNGGVNCVYVVRRLNDQLHEDLSRHPTSVSQDRMLN